MLFRLIASVLSGETADALDRLRLTMVLYALAALTAFAGFGFLVGAGFAAAAERWGTIEAALGFGVGFLLLAGFILLVRAIMMRVRRRRAERRRTTEVRTLAGAAAFALLPTILRSGGLGLLAPLAAIAAYGLYREMSGHEDGDDPDDDM